MAFFGLTALGPQNSFEAASVSHRTIQIFDDSDFVSAWERVNGKRVAFADKANILKVLRTLYHGPIPSNDIEAVDDAFYTAFSNEESISQEAYLKVMNKLRKQAEEEEKLNAGKPKPGCEFVSSSEFRESLKKNAAIKKDPRMKVTAPLTMMQEVSFDSLVPCTFS
jgi:threonyl-tRNA synthetase